VIAIVVSILTLVGVILAGSYFTKAANARISSLSLVSQALAKLQVGKDKEALEILDNAKSIAKNKDMTPYLLSADIFLMRQQYSKAMSEFDTLKKLSGAEALAAQEIARVKAEEENSTKKAAAAEKPPAETELLKSEPEPVKEKPEPPAREIKAKSKKEAATAPRPQKQRKSPSSAHQDSVSFF
jgi:hypothetical protein